MSAALLAGSHWAWAAEPTQELSEPEAIRLIALNDEVRADPIHVVSIVEGVRQCDQFQENHVRRVTVIRPVNESGGVVRRAGWYDFSWTAEYGWFLQEAVPSRGGDQMRVVSQLKGEIFIK